MHPDASPTTASSIQRACCYGDRMPMLENPMPIKWRGVLMNVVAVKQDVLYWFGQKIQSKENWITPIISRQFIAFWEASSGFIDVHALLQFFPP